FAAAAAVRVGRTASKSRSMCSTIVPFSRLIRKPSVTVRRTSESVTDIRPSIPARWKCRVLPCHSVLTPYSAANSSAAFCTSPLALAIVSEWRLTSLMSDIWSPCGSLSGSNLRAMPLHEDAVAMIERAVPRWQTAAILIEHECHDGGRGERDRHQFPKVRSFSRHLTHDVVDVLHGIEKGADDVLAAHLPAGNDLDSAQPRLFRDVFEKIVGVEHGGIVFDHDAAGPCVCGPRVKSGRGLGCSPRRSQGRAVVRRLDERLRSDAEIPRMMVNQPERFLPVQAPLAVRRGRAAGSALPRGLAQASARAGVRCRVLVAATSGGAISGSTFARASASMSSRCSPSTAAQ